MKRQMDLVAAWLVAIALLAGVAAAPLTKAGSASPAGAADAAVQRFELTRRSTMPSPAATDRNGHDLDDAARWFREGVDRL